MKTRLAKLTLGAALAVGACMAVGACRTTASDATDASRDSADSALAGTLRSGYRDITIPAGTTLPLTLTSSVASDTSVVEDTVSAKLTHPIIVDGQEVLPAGTQLTGVVTKVKDAGRVKGRATIAFRFTSLTTGNTKYDVKAAPLSRMAPSTKRKDAEKIGIGAATGAVIGGILGGKGGVAKGAVLGGAGGAGVALATKGKPVRLGPGANASTRLTAPITVRVSVGTRV